MKRAIMIGLGCLLITGCGPEGANEMEDEATPRLSTSDVDTPAEPTLDSGGIEQTIKPCPACTGQWNTPEGVLDYRIPEGVEVTSSELTLVLRYEDLHTQTCVFQGFSRKDEVAVDCGSTGSPLSAELVFLSGSTWMSVSLIVVEAAPSTN